MIYHFEAASAVVCTRLQYTVPDDHVRCDVVYIMLGWDYIRYFLWWSMTARGVI